MTSGPTRLNTVVVYAPAPALVFHSLATTTLAALILVTALPDAGNYGIPVSNFAFGGTGRSTAVVAPSMQAVLIYSLGGVPPTGSTVTSTLQLVGDSAIPSDTSRRWDPTRPNRRWIDAVDRRRRGRANRRPARRAVSASISTTGYSRCSFRTRGCSSSRPAISMPYASSPITGAGSHWTSPDVASPSPISNAPRSPFPSAIRNDVSRISVTRRTIERRARPSRSPDPPRFSAAAPPHHA